jgi:flagellar biosynthetic protein FliQ
MTIDVAVYWGQLGLWTATMCAGPLLITALVVGTVVSILQAVTQIQEATLVFVPKMIAVFGLFAAIGGWMLKTVVSFGVVMFTQIPEVGR